MLVMKLVLTGSLHPNLKSKTRMVIADGLELSTVLHSPADSRRTSSEDALTITLVCLPRPLSRSCLLRTLLTRWPLCRRGRGSCIDLHCPTSILLSVLRNRTWVCIFRLLRRSSMVDRLLKHLCECMLTMVVSPRMLLPLVPATTLISGISSPGGRPLMMHYFTLLM